MSQPCPTHIHPHQEQIRVKGLVQGVGFRPTVYRLARELDITGEVINDGDGVYIIAQASHENINQFILNLQQQCPPLARIDQIERQPAPSQNDYLEFSINASQNTNIHTGIVADAATCDQCLNDINNPENRRSGYAFTNCTHCGPRLTIVNTIPYDRANTSMAEFELCALCSKEYQNPEDRRFHAQPNACPDCGPFLQLSDNKGDTISCEDVIATAVNYLQQGSIVAIKGIGGFQLACDSTNDQALKTLRERKHRPAKSFALMAANIKQIEEYCDVSEQEKDLLLSHAAPIVILPCKEQSLTSEYIAPAQNTLGFMLPYSPLHHLLMQRLDHPIVLTSGNTASAPQCIDNEQALTDLGKIADFFLSHNRNIINRMDDSVIRVINQIPVYYRRARGYAPAPILLPEGFDTDTSILACGGELKNTFCMIKDRQAYLSQHMGDLENTQTFNDYLKNLDLYHHLFQFQAEAIAVDKHPNYLSTQHGLKLAADRDLPVLDIQHHHAHIAACLVDNNWGLHQGKVLGIAFDGLGFGDDGTIWGGEFLLADYQQSIRLARLKPVPMPGATKSILEPWRNTYAQLKSHGVWAKSLQQCPQLDLFQALQQKPLAILDQMMDSKINSPMTSSCGRLFDAVAAALGICQDHISYEGQAAIELEALIEPQDLANATAYPFELEHNELLEINPASMWKALIADLHNNTSLSLMSSRFHLFLAEVITQTAIKLKSQSGVGTVALSGGVFQNPSLLKLAQELLQQAGFIVLSHRQVPSNDGGLALGQAAIASARLSTRHSGVKS